MFDQPSRESFHGLLLRYRGRTGLTQVQVAGRLSVNIRSVQAWEAGASLPTPDRLQELIRIYLDTGVFGVGTEAGEAQALWSAADEQSSRQRPPFDRTWFTQLLAEHAKAHEPGFATQRQFGGFESATAHAAGTRLQDWGDAPDVLDFVGRERERADLAARIKENHCRLLALLGIGGIGKSMLASRLAHDVAPEVRRVYWRSLRNAPPLKEWLGGAIGFLSGQELVRGSQHG